MANGVKLQLLGHLSCGSDGRDGASCIVNNMNELKQVTANCGLPADLNKLPFDKNQVYVIVYKRQSGPYRWGVKTTDVLPDGTANINLTMWSRPGSGGFAMTTGQALVFAVVEGGPGSITKVKLDDQARDNQDQYTDEEVAKSIGHELVV